MFTERLNIAIGLVGASNAELAELYGCDRSNISRIRSGNRIPAQSSTVSRKLVAAIIDYAEKSGNYEAILEKIELSPESNKQDAEKALHDWLYGDENKGVKRLVLAPFRNFGDKLGASMNVANLSNVRLARALNVDPSHISRFRNGQRTPKSNPKLVIAICDELLNKCAAEGATDRLALLTGIPESNLTREEFQAWLCDYNAQSYDVEELLKSVSGYESSSIRPEEIDEVFENKSVYFGIEGLREAVIRFLTDAIRLGAEEVLFYSDQHIDWMTENQEFLRRWSSFMTAVVNRGIKVRIVHSIDRDSVEIVDALRCWLPIYMSGNIEAFYLKKQPNLRFSHCMLIAPGVAAIGSTSVSGREKSGAYYYHTNADEIRVMADDYDLLIKASSLLVKLGEHEHIGEARVRTINDIRITVYDNAVVVTRLREPETSFTIFHPTLIEAFEHMFDD